MIPNLSKTEPPPNFLSWLSFYPQIEASAKAKHVAWAQLLDERAEAANLPPANF